MVVIERCPIHFWMRFRVHARFDPDGRCPVPALMEGEAVHRRLRRCPRLVGSPRHVGGVERASGARGEHQGIRLALRPVGLRERSKLLEDRSVARPRLRLRLGCAFLAVPGATDADQASVEVHVPPAQPRSSPRRRPARQASAHSALSRWGACSTILRACSGVGMRSSRRRLLTAGNLRPVVGSGRPPSTIKSASR